MDHTDVELRLQEVLRRWERRLDSAVAAWEALPAGERIRRERDLDEAGEADEWVRMLWTWWERSTPGDQALLRDDVAFLAPVLRSARRAGRLAGDDEEAASSRLLLEALERMEGILGIEPG
ncbi:MAG TPA: hypothetical protein VI854_05205 [Acidimicrobiia bacterium]|nr:hypothetical protein [Acidimicrobiia bacterium]